MSEQRDILERLRDPLHGTELRIEAADEIASLRAQLSGYATENTNLRNDLVQLGMAKDGELDRLRAQLAEANKKLMMADGTLTLERGVGIDTHATMVATCQHFAAKQVELEAQLASARKALEEIANGEEFRAIGLQRIAQAALTDELHNSQPEENGNA